MNIPEEDYDIIRFGRYVFAVEKKTDGNMGYEEVNWKKACLMLQKYIEIWEVNEEKEELKK